MHQGTDRAGLRAMVVACQAATLLITWPLWQVREEPPLLPLWALPQLPFGVALLISLASVLRWPLAGTLLHTVLLAVAMVMDQTREQPQLVSMALLLWACLPSPHAQRLGVLHLTALWLWSGIGKLTSQRFLGQGGAWLFAGQVAEGSAAGVGAALALGTVEILLALAALQPRWRSRAAVPGCALHIVILCYLSPLCRDANPAVWPWNASLAMAAFVLLREPGPLLRGCGQPARAMAALLLLVLPVGYQAGLVDAAFAHQVYTLSGPQALRLHGDGRTELPGELSPLRVLLPAVPRIQEAWFERTGAPGDRLAILEDRWLARLLGQRDRLVRLPAEKVRP